MPEIYYEDSLITEYQGHVIIQLRSLPSESVHYIVTSPPYWGLRDYGLEPQVWDEDVNCVHEWGKEKKLPAHPDRSTGDHDANGNGIFVDRIPRGTQAAKSARGDEKSQGQFCLKCGAWRGSLGLEPTPELYIQHIVQIWRELKRVLRKDGTCWLNIGDSYASGKGHCFNPGGGDTSLGKNRKESGAHPLSRGNVSDLKKSGLKPKDLCMIPARIALALQADGWWLRSDIIWAKPNPMPESVTDRPTNAYEHVFLLTKSKNYFYDADTIREESIYGPGCGWKDAGQEIAVKTANVSNPAFRAIKPNCNLRNVWTIATEPTPEAHFATFPKELVKKCILAGTSEKGCCPECGAPWVRVVEKKDPGRRKVISDYPGKQTLATSKYIHDSGSVESKTIGWKPSCKCDSKPIPCTVLDPFSGSGKALIVAKKFGRKGIGIDLKKEYLNMPLPKIAQERLF